MIRRLAAAEASRPSCAPVPRSAPIGAPPSLHAQLPVVALDSGASGAEIRVRIVNTNRVLRARILSAQDVAIIVAGA